MTNKPVSRFSQLPPEEQDAAYDKIVDDRDTALRVTRTMASKVDVLSSHLTIVGDKLKLTNPRLTRYELKVLLECLEEEL